MLKIVIFDIFWERVGTKSKTHQIFSWYLHDVCYSFLATKIISFISDCIFVFAHEPPRLSFPFTHLDWLFSAARPSSEQESLSDASSSSSALAFLELVQRDVDALLPVVEVIGVTWPILLRRLNCILHLARLVKTRCLSFVARHLHQSEQNWFGELKVSSILSQTVSSKPIWQFNHPSLMIPVLAKL